MSGVTNVRAQASPSAIESTLIQSRYVLGPVIQKLGLDIAASKHHWPFFGRFVKHDPNAISVTQLTVPASWVNKKLSIIKNSTTTFSVYDPNGNLVAKGCLNQPTRSKTIPDFNITVNTLKGSIGTAFDVKKIRQNDAVKRIKQALMIDTNNASGYANTDTGVITLTYSGNSPAYVVSVLNTILETAYNLGIKQQSLEAEKIISFLGKQIPTVKAQLQHSEDILSTYQTKSGNLGISAQAQVLLQQIVSVNQQLEQLKLSKTELLQKYTAKHPFGCYVKQQD